MDEHDTHDETQDANPALPQARHALRAAMNETDDARRRLGEASFALGDRTAQLDAAQIREGVAFDDLVSAVAAQRREAAQP